LRSGSSNALNQGTTIACKLTLVSSETLPANI
jgi:hypothetical protein